MELLSSADRVFEVLGGIKAVAAITGSKYKTAHHWKSSGSFPSDTYVALKSALRRSGYTADPKLWDMRPEIQQ